MEPRWRESEIDDPRFERRLVAVKVLFTIAGAIIVGALLLREVIG